MSRRPEKARKQRAARLKMHERGADVPASAAPSPQPGYRFWHSVGHPLVLVALGTAGVVVGVMRWTPVLLVCEVCILLALHRSGILRGKGKFFEVTTYLIVSLVSTPLLLGVGIWMKGRASASREIATGGKPQASAPVASVPASNPIPRGGFFTLPGSIPTGSIPTAASPAPQAASPEPAEDQPPPANSAEAALMREMRDRLTRDAGDPQKVSLDVQWMRDQFEAGWSQEPPELAKRYRDETEETAKMILSNASNRAAVLSLLPHITIDK
jgi:hypothetical protein